MKNVVVANFPVGPRFNGGAMTVWGIINALFDQNEEIFLILLCDIKIKEDALYKICIDEIKKKGIAFEIVYFDDFKKEKINKFKDFAISLFTGRPDYFFKNQYFLNQIITAKLSNIKIKRFFVYHFDALSACYKNKNQKIYACLGDLMHEPRNYSRIMKSSSLKSKLVNIFEKLLSIRISIKMFEQLHFVGFYAHHYYTMMKKFYPTSQYIRTSIVAPKNYKFENKITQISKFLLIGDLTGTVSKSTTLFLNKFLRKYHEKIKANITFHFYGSGKLNSDYEKFKHKVIHHGVSNNISKELNNESCLLVCNEIELGIRVRIITALSHGSLVLTHSSNIKGIPELKNQYNCLVFDNVDELFEIIQKLSKNEINIQPIQKNAYKTFERYFHYGPAFSDLIEKSI